MTNKILRWIILLALFIWFLTSDCCAQYKEKKPINSKIFWFAGSAIIVGSVLTMPDKEIKATPLLGVGVVAVGFTLDLRNLRTKKRSKTLRNSAKHFSNVNPPWQ